MLSRYKPVDTPSGHWISGLLGILVSICVFMVSAVLANNAFDFIQSSSRAKGVVVRQVYGKHHVDVQFQTAKGNVVIYRQNGFISHEVGDKVTVLYNADDPRIVPSTDAFGALWEGTLMFFLMGIFWMCLSWAAMFRPHLVHVRGFGG